MKRKSVKLVRLGRFSWYRMTAAILPLLVIGIGVTWWLHAAGTPVAFEAESGTVAGTATTTTTAGASAGLALKFGAAVTPTPSPGAFTHPGVMLGSAQLAFVKAKIAAGAEPWTSTYNKAKASNAGSLNFVPQPAPVIQCGSPGNGASQPNCDAALTASINAYTDALLYSYSGNIAYANKAIEIMNAYANTTTSFAFDTTVYTGGLLQAAWGAENFTRAAEIIRYSGAGWSTADVSKFEALLTNVYLPRVRDGWAGGGSNWLLSMADATTAIGVFTNNRAVYDEGLADLQAQIAPAVYLTSDVNTHPSLQGSPIPPPGTNFDRPSTTAAAIKTMWSNPSSYINGLEQETCRDMTHMDFSLEAIGSAFETARLQGTDLYTPYKTRLTTTVELHAKWINASLNGQPQPSDWVCPAPINLGGSGYQLGWEILYNGYATRMGQAMPQTQALITKTRALSHGVGVHINWEILTSPGTP